MGNSLTSFNIPQLSAAILVCRVLRDTRLTIRDLRECEVRTDKNQRCSDPRVEPEKHRWVTVRLHVREPQNKRSTLSIAIDEFGVNPPKKQLCC